MATAPIEQVRQEVASRYFGQVTASADVVVCRKIANSDSWSQHAWNNAVDLYPPNDQVGNDLYAWLLANKTRLSLRTICWKDKGGCTTVHSDHVHVDAYPHKTGTPPCAKGTDQSGSTPGASLGGTLLTPPGFGWLLGGTNKAAGTILTTGEALTKLFQAETWVRVMWFVGGSIAMVAGVTIFLKQAAGIDVPVGKVVKTVAKVAAA